MQELQLDLTTFVLSFSQPQVFGLFGILTTQFQNPLLQVRFVCYCIILIQERLVFSGNIFSCFGVIEQFVSCLQGSVTKLCESVGAENLLKVWKFYEVGPTL